MSISIKAIYDNYLLPLQFSLVCLEDVKSLIGSVYFPLGKVKQEKQVLGVIEVPQKEKITCSFSCGQRR